MRYINLRQSLKSGDVAKIIDAVFLMSQNFNVTEAWQLPKQKGHSGSTRKGNF